MKMGMRIISYYFVPMGMCMLYLVIVIMEMLMLTFIKVLDLFPPKYVC